MIGLLRGELYDRAGNEVLIDVSGVGYRVLMSSSGLKDLPTIGSALDLHIHHHVREDAQTLYGFLAKAERVAFEALISAHGVGPKLGLDILSVYAPTQLHNVLANDDVDALCLVPGVGKKTATRLLVELKSKLDLPDVVDLAALSGDDTETAGPSALADVRDALGGLGYSPEEIRHAVAKFTGDDRDSGALLKDALKVLAAR